MAFCIITDSSDVKPKCFYSSPYLRICSTSTDEWIPSVIVLSVLRGLPGALERAKSNIQSSSLPCSQGLCPPRGTDTDGFAAPGIPESAEIHEGHKTRASERLLLWLLVVSFFKMLPWELRVYLFTLKFYFTFTAF